PTQQPDDEELKTTIKESNDVNDIPDAVGTGSHYQQPQSADENDWDSMTRCRSRGSSSSGKCPDIEERATGQDNPSNKYRRLESSDNVQTPNPLQPPERNHRKDKSGKEKKEK